MKTISYSKKLLNGVQIKRCSNALQSYKNHLHSELSIGYIEKGSTVICINGEETEYFAGEGILIPPYVTHMCSPQSVDNWQFVMMYIDVSAFTDNYFESIIIRKLTQDELDKYINIFESIDNNQPQFEQQNAIIDFLVSVLCKSEKYETPIDVRIADVHTHIKEHFLDQLSLDMLQELFSYNKFSMIRDFKATYNTTPSAFQIQLKANYSKELLSKVMSLTDVCYLSGFYDQSHFTREFKKAFGITPQKYREALS